MRVIVDSSVLLRKLFGEPEPLAEWSSIVEAYASRILLVEVGRVIDRCRLEGRVDDEQVAHLHQEAHRILRSIDLIELTNTILERAATAMPTVLGSLDALHLVTALELRRSSGKPLAVATHDRQLARAARASGFTVYGA